MTKRRRYGDGLAKSDRLTRAARAGYPAFSASPPDDYKSPKLHLSGFAKRERILANLRRKGISFSHDDLCQRTPEEIEKLLNEPTVSRARSILAPLNIGLRRGT